MSASSARRRRLRWMFLALGILMCTAPPVAAYCILNAPRLAVYLYPARGRWQAHFLELLLIAVLVTGLLCLITAWGLKRRRVWARWTGLCASVLLLPGFPVLTVPGAIGLFFLGVKPLPAEPESASEDYWSRARRESLPQWILFVVSLPWVFLAMVWLGLDLGLPLKLTGSDLWVLVFGQVAVLMVHELGHSLAAWAASFRIVEIRIGPLTIPGAGGGPSFWFDWRGFLRGGAYMAAVPQSDRHLRFNQMLISIAGPLASFLVGAVLFIGLAGVRGTVWEEDWQTIAVLSVLFLVDSIQSLIPIGYRDGAVLMHLLRGTQRGDELISQLLIRKEKMEARERAVQSEGASSRREGESGDLELGPIGELDTAVDLLDREVEIRLWALERAIADGLRDPEQLGLAYWKVAAAQLGARRWQEAELNLKRCLELFERCRERSPGLEVLPCVALHGMYCQQQRVGDARQAYVSGMEVGERARAARGRRIALHEFLAYLQANAGNFDLALQEVNEALAAYPGFSSKTALLELRMESEFRLGRAALGLKAAEEAERLIRLGVANGDRIESLRGLAALGILLWDAGRSGRGAALLEEAIAMLDKRGVPSRVLRWRLKLAEVLWRAGRVAEAEAALPSEEQVIARHRYGFLGARGQIRLRSGRVVEAIADFEERLRLTKEDPHALATEVAMAEVELAVGYRLASRLDDAEALARHSLEILRSAEHPNAAAALETLALIAWQRQQDSAKILHDAAVQVLLAAPLLGPASKARWFEDAARDLERAGRTEEAKELRSLAAAQWRSLGLETGAEETLINRK